MPPSRFFPNACKDYDAGNFEIGQQHIITEVHNMIDNITANLKPVQLNGEDGLYLGTAGIAYMFYHLSKISTFQSHSSAFIDNATEYLQPSLAVAQKYACSVKDVPSFLLGNCGIYAIASVIYHVTKNKEQSDYFRNLFYEAGNTCKEIQFLDCGSDELFVGRAGYLCAALWLAKETNTELKLQDLYDICHVMVASGRKYATLHHSDCALMYAYYDVEYVGAAHGLCSILQVLLSVPGYLDANSGDAKHVKSAVDYLLDIQDAEGNFPAAINEVTRKNELLHWCHGAPGIIYLMAKAYLTWTEDKYLQSCKKMGEIVWRKGLLKKGPGLCHGIAGNAYVFLLLYRLTNEQKYLHRANVFAQFMETEDFKRQARVPDNPFSLFEGIAGTVCFLGDLTMPSQAAFPFFNVF
ncbi:hypothetical protein RN001_000310 [Aquatica leii]|uniref:LanC-like protein 3 homolog n=1 Tax=Aquatica leii TaxID=1421715 RepID=A0AAN7SKG9_9COLE|nr:hypothetical protein RN001_000310 [Aquatica leii]